ncbi:predicted protein [Meyerozyma guilliermondii ATCC 6260]|uniref:Uncharacterized protein n=1 Tax=Meyerozyma guilliermondii (strain ATCC 6260 / CBS 566 / DSM 6381 / JCM 1539 / NBRC 10279 / NRRL Y-324) TaxID=294746 RepID=A5DK16_PICGU|nr:uncharacterized protein PGUG_03617 [Meyerozyma guilliermondii ATCC 6260]EDK39519.2 predicted protein [Meyerozyma guilliermondii ATCC 6260]
MQSVAQNFICLSHSFMLTFISPKNSNSNSLEYVLRQIDLQYSHDPNSISQLIYINGSSPSKIVNLLDSQDFTFASDANMMTKFHYIRCETLANIIDAVSPPNITQQTTPNTVHVISGRVVIVDEPVSVGFRSGHDYVKVNAELVSVAQKLKKSGCTSYILDNVLHFLSVQANAVLEV